MGAFSIILAIYVTIGWILAESANDNMTDRLPEPLSLSSYAGIVLIWPWFVAAYVMKNDDEDNNGSTE
jgi:hypothetical protein